MSKYYNKNYTKDQIDAIVQKIHECVSNGKCTVAMNENRAENLAFIREYNLNTEKQRHLLMQIDTKDFCHTLNNMKPGYEHEVLYVFCPQATLFSLDDEENQLDLYTKFNIIEMPTGSRVVVISFHKLNKPY